MTHHTTSKLSYHRATSRSQYLRNSSMGPPWRIDPLTHHTTSKRSYHRATSRSQYLRNTSMGPPCETEIIWFTFIVLTYKSRINNNKWWTYALVFENFALEPGQVVDSDLALLARDGDQDVLALQHLHLLETPSWDQRVHWNRQQPVRGLSTICKNYI